MQYRALSRGYVHGRVIEPDETFEWEGPQGKWMEPVSSPPSDTADGAPPTPVAAVPSTNPDLPYTSVEDLLEVHSRISADLKPDELTQSGYPKKTVLESHLGREVPKDVFFNFIKVAAEQRRAAN